MIVQFPVTDNEKVISRRILGLREDLETYWAGLEEIHGHLHQMEQLTLATEEEYNFLIRKLADIRGGIEEVPVDMLEYATNLQIDGDTYQFIPEEEPNEE